MKYSGINRPEVESLAPKVNVFPAIAFGSSVPSLSPVAALAMKYVTNCLSSSPWTIAWEPGTAERACRPDSPPNQPICTWLLLNAATDAAYVFTGTYFTSTLSCLLRYAAILSKRSRRRASLSSGMAVNTNGLASALPAPRTVRSRSAATEYRIRGVDIPEGWINLGENGSLGPKLAADYVPARISSLRESFFRPASAPRRRAARGAPAGGERALEAESGQRLAGCDHHALQPRLVRQAAHPQRRRQARAPQALGPERRRPRLGSLGPVGPHGLVRRVHEQHVP